MNEWNQFFLLMWKHYHLRRHRWITTTIEIFLPIIVAYLLCDQGGKLVSSPSHPRVINPVLRGQYFVELSAHRSLVYTPVNNVTNEIVQNVMEFTGLHKTQKVENESELVKFLSEKSSSRGEHWIGVVFSNSQNNETRPATLNYELRDTNSWSTAALFDDQWTPINGNDPYSNQGFAGIQMAIDSAFLKLWNIQFNYKEIDFQAFPYPEYTEINVWKANVSNIIFVAVILTSLTVSVPLINSVIEEKETGVKELMKLVGVNDWLIEVSWFVSAFILNFISFSIVAFFLQINFHGPGSAIIINVPAIVVWTCIIMYCIANVAFCFTFTSIFHNMTIATSVFMLVIFLLMYVAFEVVYLKSLLLVRLSCLFPISALYQGLERIKYFEIHNTSLSWSSQSKDEIEGKGVSLQFVFLMLIFDSFFYLFLSFYITAVNPGTFGTKKSPLFFLEKLWNSVRKNGGEELVNVMSNEDGKFFEKAPQTLQTALHIKDLHKNFGSVFAVKGVTLNVYKGEITALLGHNGAGKTTTLAILTGMTKPTAGSIKNIEGVDVLKCMDDFRLKLGVCPQEDRLFPYLSAINHLVFFGRLKGASKKDALLEGRNYLNLMEMKSNENDLSKSLSGGMKRKLCLSIAFMGKVDTLILDEPTSGVDTESKRKVWNLLLKMRGNRTIILTTHDMAEADVLGDRIAIMHHGTIVCHGTSMFLKKTYGTGYRVTITKGESNDSILTETLQRIVPETTMESNSDTEIVYKLPLTETAKFPELFSTLENQQHNLNINHVGVSCTTLEQVFLKAGDMSVYDVGRQKNNSATDGTSLVQYSKRKNTGISLILQQLLALFWKKFLYTKRNLMSLFFRVLLPSSIMIFLLYGFKAVPKPDLPISFNLSTYPNAKVVLAGNKTNVYDHIVSYTQKRGHQVMFLNETDVVEGLLNYSRNFLSAFQSELLLAAEFNATKKLVLYNSYAFHSLPVLINTISNSELELLTNGRGYISAINHPVPKKEESCSNDPLHFVKILLWCFTLGFFTVDVVNYFSIFLGMERTDGFKHIQFMSNVSPPIYWFGNLLFDFSFYFIVVFGRIIVIKIIDDDDHFLAFESPFGYCFMLICGYVWSGLLFTYVVNFMSKSKEGANTILIYFSILGLIITGIFYVLQKFISGAKFDSFSFSVFLYYFFKYLIFLIPPLNFMSTIIKYTSAWFDNALTKNPLCAQGNITSEFLVSPSANNPNGLLEEVIFMIINIVLYGGLLFIIEVGYFSNFVNKIISLYSVNSSSDTHVDSDVEQERKKVRTFSNEISENALLNKRNIILKEISFFDSASHESTQLMRGIDRQDSVLVVKNLKKVYFKLIKPFVAVEEVNFAVKAGECFGLLGVNGAGKSTTFKMLTGAVLPTKGDSSIQNIWLSQSKSSYLSKAGYCAQTNCFIEELTGREMLLLIASLRGIRSQQLELVVDKWLSILGLEDFQNQKCGKYSGGNKRKLCTAMSLIGDPNVVFLDEPTTGVDPVSRRKLYEVMNHSKSSGQAVVLTSHSMEECEKLCDRLTIMTYGRMRCIGSVQHLKLRYAQGFSILIKTKDMDDKETLIYSLKDAMCRVFHEFCVLKDEHEGLLYYQITDIQLKWSQLFEKMEEIKMRNTILEDYTISDTSLEEVFISFARQKG